MVGAWRSCEDAVASLVCHGALARFPQLKVAFIENGRLMADPAAYGYTNVTTPAQGLAVNPDQYLFWDTPSHPTTTGHRLIGFDAESAVLNTFAPEPATWVVAAVGLTLLVCVRRFRYT